MIKVSRPLREELKTPHSKEGAVIRYQAYEAHYMYRGQLIAI